MKVNNSKHGGIRNFVMIFIFSILPAISGRVELTEDVLEILRQKGGNHNPENRVMVGFKSQSDPMTTFQYSKSSVLSPEMFRAVAGERVIQEMNRENEELEQMLQGIVQEAQIVRRIPAGNVFILQDLTIKQAEVISELELTAILELSEPIESQEVELPDEPFSNDFTGKALLKCADFKKDKLSAEMDDDFLFGEPIYDVKAFEEAPNSRGSWHPLHKAGTINNMKPQWNIERVNAPKSWALGYTGKGIIHGVIDSGVNFKHALISNNYMGRKEDGTFNHNYSWYDAIGNVNSGSSRSSWKRPSPPPRPSPPRWPNNRSPHRPFSTAVKEPLEDEEYDADYHDNESVEEEELFEEPVNDVINLTTSTCNDDGDDDDDTRISVRLKSTQGGSVLSSVMKSLKQAAFKSCSIPSREPCDNAGHGTHVTSTAVGSRGFGVAPEAKWMACRSVTDKYGRAEDALACLNFFLAPHDLNGQNPRPELRPHVIGNSYGWNNWAEVSQVGIGLAVRRLEAAGTFMVYASGNSGPGCGTTHSAFSFTVGATTSQGTLASFSSRGPWTTNPTWSNRPPHPQFPYMIKPNVCAPGDQIQAGIRDDLTAKMSGTSMATPHVSGAVALLRKQTKTKQSFSFFIFLFLFIYLTINPSLFLFLFILFFSKRLSRFNR